MFVFVDLVVGVLCCVYGGGCGVIGLGGGNRYVVVFLLLCLLVGGCVVYFGVFWFGWCC